MIQRARSFAARRRGATQGFLAVVVAVAAWSCSDTSYVDRLTIVNDTDYPANVSVSGESSDGWLALATSRQGSTQEVDRVIDQGERWTFRWDYGGAHSEQISLTRAELERAGWRVEVPQSFEDALREMDLPSP